MPRFAKPIDDLDAVVGGGRAAPRTWCFVKDYDKNGQPNGYLDVPPGIGPHPGITDASEQMAFASDDKHVEVWNAPVHMEENGVTFKGNMATFPTDSHPYAAFIGTATGADGVEHDVKFCSNASDNGFSLYPNVDWAKLEADDFNAAASYMKKEDAIAGYLAAPPDGVGVGDTAVTPEAPIVTVPASASNYEYQQTVDGYDPDAVGY
jgi:hypothetical protein